MIYSQKHPALIKVRVYVNDAMIQRTIIFLDHLSHFTM